MTFPKKLDDSPAHKLGEFPGVKGIVHYKEDIFVGYRYFDTYKVEPQFAFGHGLSYTTFNYENAAIQKTGDKQVTASVTLKNTGRRDGAEVVQFYAEPINPRVPRPRKELKGFEKVFLKAGETKTIKVMLNKDAFSYYDDKKKAWVADNGEYLIAIGNSSKDIQVSRTLLL